MKKSITASEMGKLGGKARAKAINGKQRSAIAKLGGLARAAKAAKQARKNKSK